MLQGVWKQHLRPRAVVGYGLKIFLPSPPNYVIRSPGDSHGNSCKPFAHSSFVELCKLTTIFCAERSLIASGKVTEWTCIKHTFLSLKGVLKTTKRGGNEASIVRADYPNAVYSLVAPLYLLLPQS